MRETYKRRFSRALLFFFRKGWGFHAKKINFFHVRLPLFHVHKNTVSWYADEKAPHRCYRVRYHCSRFVAASPGCLFPKISLPLSCFLFALDPTNFQIISLPYSREVTVLTIKILYS